MNFDKFPIKNKETFLNNKMKQKQQIVHVHGGESWSSIDKYVNYLETKKCDPYASFKKSRWHYNYYSFLDKNEFDLIKPEMPCKQNAHYDEWKIWFERHIEFMNNNIVLVGHSLGGNFLAKYLSGNILPVSIKQLHLISASYEEFEDDFKITEFPKNFFQNDIGEVHIYHSTDDDLVPISESEKYHVDIPNSIFHKFSDRGHFLDETFLEFFENIKKSQ